MTTEEGDKKLNSTTEKTKEISSVVRRLRFMRVKDEEFYKQQLKVEHQKLKKNLQWHAPDWDDAEEIYNKQLKARRLEEYVSDGLTDRVSFPKAALRMHGRRSFGKFNLPVESFMSSVDQRIYKRKIATVDSSGAFLSSYRGTLNSRKARKDQRKKSKTKFGLGR